MVYFPMLGGMSVCLPIHPSLHASGLSILYHLSSIYQSSIYLIQPFTHPPTHPSSITFTTQLGEKLFLN